MTEIAAAYDGWAEVYDTDTNRTRDLAADVLRRAPLDLAGRRVLELGCGTGANTRWLAERAGSVVALDFSDYVSGAVQAGFDLRDMGEWRDPESPRTALPRLLSAHFRVQ